MPHTTVFIACISDEWLVAAAQRGDPHATDALLRRYERFVLQICRKLRIPRGVDPGDITQAARIGALGAIRTWHPGSTTFRGYLATCARRKAIDAIDAGRSPAARALSDAISLDALAAVGLEPPSPTGDPAVSAIARDELAAAIATLATLTHRQRACLIGAMSGYSYPELALLLATTRKAVSESVRRARRTVIAALRGP